LKPNEVVNDSSIARVFRIIDRTMPAGISKNSFGAPLYENKVHLLPQYQQGRNRPRNLLNRWNHTNLEKTLPQLGRQEWADLSRQKDYVKEVSLRDLAQRNIVPALLKFNNQYYQVGDYEFSNRNAPQEVVYRLQPYYDYQSHLRAKSQNRKDGP